MLKLIGKINQFLFFVAAVLLIALFANELYGKWKPHDPYDRPKVSLADPLAEDEIDIELEQGLNLVEILNGVYIFSVENETIDLSKNRESGSVAEYRLPEYGHYSDKTVNYIFTNVGGYKKVLLEKDALVLKFLPANFGEYKGKPHFDKNVYHVVESDSNNDGFLTGDDSKSLYLSDFDGQNLSLIIRDVVETYIIDENTIVIVTKFDGKKAFFNYSVKDSKLYQFDVSTKLTSLSS